MAKNTIRTGDTIKVIAGKDKGVEGKVISVVRAAGHVQRVIVEGANQVRRHTPVVNTGGKDGRTGGIMTVEAPIHVSNVRKVDAKADKAAAKTEKAEKAPAKKAAAKKSVAKETTAKKTAAKKTTAKKAAAKKAEKSDD